MHSETQACYNSMAERPVLSSNNQSGQHCPPPWTELNELSSNTLGGKVLFSTDDWFAPAEMVLSSDAAVWKEGFTEQVLLYIFVPFVDACDRASGWMVGKLEGRGSLVMTGASLNLDCLVQLLVLSSILLSSLEIMLQEQVYRELG